MLQSEQAPDQIWENFLRPGFNIHVYGCQLHFQFHNRDADEFCIRDSYFITILATEDNLLANHTQCLNCAVQSQLNKTTSDPQKPICAVATIVMRARLHNEPCASSASRNLDPNAAAKNLILA